MLKRCLRTAAALAVLGATLWVAGPALSTTRYMPGGVDFNQKLPQLRPVTTHAAARAAAATGRRPVRFRSAPVAAPKRFDLVGIGGEMGNYEVRVRDGGAPWSDWIELGDGSPLYTGGSTEVQVRSRGGKPPRGRLHYVNVSGDDTTTNAILNRVRGAINGAVIGVFDSSDAIAASPKPDFVTRRQWGANAKHGGCKPRVKPEYGRVKAIAVHHTVSVNNYSRAEAPGIVLGICRYHRNGNGWNDIGYNALVDRFGNVYQGRAGGQAKPVVGAQAGGFNSLTAGVATIGNHQQVKARAREKRGVISYLAWRLDKAGIPAIGKATLKSGGGSDARVPEGHRLRVGRIFGHRDVDFTDCPGDLLYKKLPAIKRKVQDRIDQFGGSTDGGGGGGGGGLEAVEEAPAGPAVVAVVEAPVVAVAAAVVSTTTAAAESARPASGPPTARVSRLRPPASGTAGRSRRRRGPR